MPGSLRIAVANSVEVRFNGRKENLHSLWDTALVELEQGTPSEIAARMQSALTVEDRQQWQEGTAAKWALESLAIVRAQVIGCLHRTRSPQLHRIGTCCDPYSFSASWSTTRLAAESDVPAVKSIRQDLVNSGKRQA